jgi:NAD(P)-dependent dehydrogenase (short-subunit alcohol dehydrogenase family)
MASALDDITAATGCKMITAWALDLNSHASVKAFVDRIQELDRLDILICNAGLQNGSFKVKEGHEETCDGNKRL